ncbi:MAG: DUF87 domain-containing protein [Candidatus Kaiserbacteria bacterium]|nr:DUF87 domain-containing protein [Candidatus Kaiserbacteria bacterium]
MGLFDVFKKNEKGDPTDDFIPEEMFGQESVGIRDVIAPAAIQVTPKNISLGNKYARSFAIVSYPRFLNEGWFTPIINLNKEFDISIFVHPMTSKDVLRKFRKKVAQVEGQVIEREQKGLVRDPKLDTAYHDLEELRSKIQQATERMFEVGVYITIYGESLEEIEDVEKEMRSELEGRLIFIKPTVFQQEQGFKSTSPFGTDVLAIHTKLNSDPLSSLFPFVSFNLSAEKGILYGVNQHNASLILFDRFSLPNYNSVTFATSGAGKSYAMKLEVLRSLMIGVDVIVIDPEREFEQLAKAVNGRYFNVSLNSEHHINPFDLPPVDEDENPADVLKSNVINLIGFFRILFDNLNKNEESIIDRAIYETYALKDITPSSESFENIEPPLLSDFALVLGGIEGGEDLAERLSRYTTGTWAGFVNEPTNISMNKNLVVFSIRDMEEELKTAAMYIITRYIWNSIRQNIRKRLLVVDEAWIMMQAEDTAAFLFGLVKRGRKYYLGIGTITQDVGDFLESRYGRSILNNSSLILLLRQSATTIDLVQEIFNLTDNEKYLLLEANVGEGLFIAGLKRVAIKIIASLTEDKIITTDPSQLLNIEREKIEV